MSAISGIPGAVRPAMLTSAGAQNPGAAAAKVRVRDSDGDHDGTASGQVDARDFGKGVNLDKKA
jgi:hypothetical protein